MKEKNLFPISILEQSSERIFNEESHLSEILYLAVIAVVVGTLTALFFLKVDVTVHAPGVIKPKEDHTAIITTAPGYVRSTTLLPNTHINEGDTLLVIESDLITSRLPMLEKRREELKLLTLDLRNLTTKSPHFVNLLSPMYKQDVLYYVAQWNEADAKRKHAQNAYERSKRLYDANVIPLSEYEPVELQYTLAESAVELLTEYQKRQWQFDLYSYEKELEDIEAQISQINIQSSETVVVSPVTGTIRQVQMLFDGSYVMAGQQIADISPDGDLIAECYIQPKDIGYLKTGMQGRVQVSAFNYTEWGILPAIVDDVFDDITISPDGTQSYYKVYCILESDHLKLKNGFEGYIKKGMVVNTNFIVTRRTIFQLLYDKINDWMNPTTI